MTKEDLETGMRVRTRNGDLYLVLKDYSGFALFFAEFIGNDYITGRYYSHDLLCEVAPKFDIVEVYGIDKFEPNENVLNHDCLYSIWKRKEVKEVTMQEVCEKFGCTVKIIKE